MTGTTVSVVIPTLNESANLPLLLADLAGESRPHEIIVVDGGSADDTVEIAAAHGAEIVVSRPGRGHQLMAGAARASAPVLLFLHADCRFPAGGLDALTDALNSNPRSPGGNFRLLFDGDDGFSHWLDRFYAAIRRRGFYYGDSGIFVRAAIYQALGGFRPLELMEDYAFVRQLERAGPTLCLEPPLVTSSRRFRNRSARAIVAGWIWIHILFYSGISSRRLARIYRSRHQQPVRDTEGPNPSRGH